MAVPHHGETLLQVGLDLLVHLGDRPALILRTERLFRLRDVRDAQVRRAGLLVVLHREDVHEHEMGVGPADERLAVRLDQGRVVAQPHLVHRFDGLVGVGDGQVEIAPDVLRALVVALGDVLPVPDFVAEPGGLRILDAVVVEIVRHQLGDAGITRRGIGGAHQRNRFLRGVDFRTVVRVLVQELVTGGQGQDGQGGNTVI